MFLIFVVVVLIFFIIIIYSLLFLLIVVICLLLFIIFFFLLVFLFLIFIFLLLSIFFLLFTFIFFLLLVALFRLALVRQTRFVDGPVAVFVLGGLARLGFKDTTRKHRVHLSAFVPRVFPLRKRILPGSFCLDRLARRRRRLLWREAAGGRRLRIGRRGDRFLASRRLRLLLECSRPSARCASLRGLLSLLGGGGLQGPGFGLGLEFGALPVHGRRGAQPLGNGLVHHRDRRQVAVLHQQAALVSASLGLLRHFEADQLEQGQGRGVRAHVLAEVAARHADVPEPRVTDVALEVAEVGLHRGGDRPHVHPGLLRLGRELLEQERGLCLELLLADHPESGEPGLHRRQMGELGQILVRVLVLLVWVGLVGLGARAEWGLAVRAHRGAGRPQEELLEGLPTRNPDEGVDDFALLHRQDGGQRHHLEGLGQILVQVAVHLCNSDAPAGLFRHVLEHGREHLARAAPLRMKVHQDGDGAVEYFFLEVCRGHVEEHLVQFHWRRGGGRGDSSLGGFGSVRVGPQHVDPPDNGLLLGLLSHGLPGFLPLAPGLDLVEHARPRRILVPAVRHHLLDGFV
mmetsp:Transcript_25963/g.58229  ORF Transcript_25963/g.58229 Transcript_25963/m.58229 type:complete len:572 (-) Transcript_25963:639-2354(-)